jgi:hypothetical protein
MRFHSVTDKPPRLEFGFFFVDSRSVDLDVALHIICQENSWTIVETSRDLLQINYEVRDRENFLAGVQFTHGLEPPTRATFVNRPAGKDYWPASRPSVVMVATTFLDECANRGLVSPAQKQKAVADLKRHDKVEV